MGLFIWMEGEMCIIYMQVTVQFICISDMSLAASPAVMTWMAVTLLVEMAWIC